MIFYIIVLLAIVFGAIALKKNKFRKMGIAGFVLGIIGFAPFLIYIITSEGSILISNLTGSVAKVEEEIVTPPIIQSQTPDFTANNSEYTRNLYDAVYKGDIGYIQTYIENFSCYSNGHDETFSNEDLRLLRNTIYAIHGNKFRSKNLQEHFQKFSWYKGTKENVEDELNENELQLIRVILAMEAANPPDRNDLIGWWKLPVPASVESIGFIDLYLGADGKMEGFDGSIRGYWSLEGTTFRTRQPDDQQFSEFEATWPVNWFGELKNLRIIVFEYNGQLYRACDFFGSILDGRVPGKAWFQEEKPPSDYWGY
jgi:hypothetical protein